MAVCQDVAWTLFPGDLPKYKQQILKYFSLFYFKIFFTQHTLNTTVLNMYFETAEYPAAPFSSTRTFCLFWILYFWHTRTVICQDQPQLIGNLSVRVPEALQRRKQSTIWLTYANHSLRVAENLSPRQCCSLKNKTKTPQPYPKNPHHQPTETQKLRIICQKTYKEQGNQCNIKKKNKNYNASACH